MAICALFYVQIRSKGVYGCQASQANSSRMCWKIRPTVRQDRALGMSQSVSITQCKITYILFCCTMVGSPVVFIHSMSLLSCDCICEANLYIADMTRMQSLEYMTHNATGRRCQNCRSKRACASHFRPQKGVFWSHCGDHEQAEKQGNPSIHLLVDYTRIWLCFLNFVSPCNVGF